MIFITSKSRFLTDKSSKNRLFFFVDPRRHRILVTIYTNIFIGIGANPKQTEIAIQYFRGFRRTIVSLFRDSHFYALESLCSKKPKCPLSHLACMREMKEKSYAGRARPHMSHLACMREMKDRLAKVWENRNASHLACMREMKGHDKPVLCQREHCLISRVCGK